MYDTLLFIRLDTQLLCVQWPKPHKQVYMQCLVYVWSNYDFVMNSENILGLNFKFMCVYVFLVSQHKLFNEHLVSASGNPALVLRRKKHLEKEVHAELVSVLSVRLREGYTIREINFAKGNHHKLQNTTPPMHHTTPKHHTCTTQNYEAAMISKDHKTTRKHNKNTKPLHHQNSRLALVT